MIRSSVATLFCGLLLSLPAVPQQTESKGTQPPAPPAPAATQKPTISTTTTEIIVPVTVTDSKIFTKPFTINFVEQLLPDTDVFEHICYENEKDAAHLPGKAGK